MILLLGVLLRFYKMGERGAFRADQAIELSGARDILSGKFTLIGIKTSNSEVRNGAVMYYLLAPFVYLFQEDPKAGGVLQSLLSLGTILIVFLIIKNNIDTKQALYGAFLTATSSLLIVYSRQTMLAFYPLFFNALIFLICTSIAKKYRSLMAICLGLLLGFSMQIHYSTLALVLVSFLIPPIFLKRRNWLSYLSMTLIGFLLGFSPMIAFEMRHEFFNTKMFFALISQPSNQNLLASLTNMIVFWQDAVSRLLFGGNIWLARIYLLLILGATIILRKQISNLQKLALLFIFSSLVFTAIFSRDLRPPYEQISHYAVISFTPLIVLTSWLLGKLRPLFSLILIVVFLIVNFPMYQFGSTHGFSHSEGWNALGIKKAASLIKSDLTNRPYNVVMLVDAENQGHPLRYLLGSLSNKPLPIDKYNQAKDLYVITEPGLNLKNVNLWEINSFGDYNINKSWNIQNGYLLHKLSKKSDDKPQSFVTLIYPVRGRNLWGDKSLTHLDDIFGELNIKKFPSTWLLQYDALKDNELAAKIKKDCPRCEFGLFLEVSEILATDSDVSYTIGEGHWYRPDKIFLSGYSLSEREILLKKYFDVFKEKFGENPKSIGVWYLDPFSLNYVADNYGVSGFVSVADQFDTDGQRYWGKPWGTPFYSQKYDTLAPANNLANKSVVVQLQWAQRHPSEAFGTGPKISQNSLQANDYINNQKDTEYFKTLLDIYLFNPKNPFGQATIGLEVGQELSAFFPEHVNQLSHLSSLERVKFLTMSEFSDWYKKTYPFLSPKTQISDGKTTWINRPCERVSELDKRNYSSVIISKDLLAKDQNTFLDRQVGSKNQKCGSMSGQENLELKIQAQLLKEKIKQPLSIFKWSNISGARIFGVQIGKEEIFGYWAGKGIGNYHFPFQTLAKFKSLNL